MKIDPATLQRPQIETYHRREARNRDEDAEGERRSGAVMKKMLS